MTRAWIGCRLTAMWKPAISFVPVNPKEGENPVAELRIPLSHPVLQHSGVIGCALRGQVIDRVKVTATQLVIYSHRRRSHDD